MAGEIVAVKQRSARRRKVNQIPDDILNDAELQAAMKQLPWNYNFEIPKTIWKIRQAQAKIVALQFPEGLLLYSCLISDIIKHFTQADTIILGDVTYGACCVDDLTAKALGADFMIHYGHSCLVPIDITSIKMLYVFVTIAIDVDHMVECIKLTFEPATKLALLGTIQFSTAIHTAAERLKEHFADLVIPQVKPLSPGEVLGCTSPVLAGRDAMVFVADGRFHMEAAMIANSNVKAFRYDPYPKLLTLEEYDTPLMHSIRQDAIQKAQSANVFGVILGTLGRQGNTTVLTHVTEMLKAHGKEYFIILLSEIFPGKLEMFQQVDAWIQIACPRLSIDWGYAFPKPVLSPYEAEVCLGETEWKSPYPMDFYARGSGPWTNYHKK